MDSQAQDIVKWAEAHTGEKPAAPNTGARHLSPDDIADILFYQRQGLTQEQIADKFDPPKHQSTISRCLREWGQDRAVEAKRMIRAAAPRMVKDIIDGKDGKAKLGLLKGGNIIEEQQTGGVIVQIGISTDQAKPTFASVVSTDSPVMHSLTGHVESDN